MCKAKNDAKTYRCNCDTSKKRQARRVSISTRKKIIEEHGITTPVSHAVLPTPQESIEVLEKEVKQLLAEYSENGDFYYCTGEERKAKYQELEQKITQIGSLTADIAEERVGIFLEDFNPPERSLLLEEAEKKLVTVTNTFNKDYSAYIDYTKQNSHMEKAIRKLRREEKPLSEEEELYQAEKSRLKNISEESREIMHTTADELKTLKELSEEEKEKLTLLSQSYLNVISESRSLASAKDSINAHEQADTASHKRAQKIVESQLGYFPSAWVEESNRTPLVMRESQTRSHYSSSRNHIFYPLGRKVKIEYMTEAVREHNQRLDPSQVLRTLSPEEKERYEKATGSHTPDHLEIVDVRSYKEFSFSGKEKWDFEKNRPKGAEWEEREYVYSDGKTRTVWAKDDTKYDKHYFVAPEVTIPKISAKQFKEYSNLKNYVESIAIHEYAHRCESTYNKNILSKLQDTFLERRTTAEDGTREDLTVIYENDGKKEKEIGYRNSFSTHYIGRVYEHANREVLSMGMEMIFKNTTGGMTRVGTGLAHKGADKDHRNFILGLLRTV